MRRALAFLAGAILTICVLVAVVIARHQEAAPLANGRPAPAFALTDQYGHPHRLADYSGRAVILAFLPDLAADSVTELRALRDTMRQFDTLGIKVFALTGAEKAEALRVHEAERLPYPILLDDGGRIAAKYGAMTGRSVVRTSYVIGPNGRVLLPVRDVQPGHHGTQMVSMAECCLDKHTPAHSPAINRAAQPVTLPTVADGKQTPLFEPGRRATVVFVLSALCPCTERYAARCAALAHEYGAQGVRFVGMDSNAGEKPAEIAEFGARNKLPFPILLDKGNVVADALGAQVTPEAFVFDKDHVMRYHGRIDDSRDPALIQSQDLRYALDAVLSGKRPAHAEVVAFGCAVAREKAQAAER